MSGLRRLLLSSFRLRPARGFGTEANNTGKGDFLPHSMGDRVTWDSFYSFRSPGGSSHFDWFFGYDFLRVFLLSLLRDLAPDGHVGPPLRVLDLGCGTSDVGLGLFRDSPHPLLVSCVDRSVPAVLAMCSHLSEGPPVTPRHPDSHLEYTHGDVTDLRGFASASVGLVLDKGTLDALLRTGTGEARMMLQESLRVLQPGGKLVQLTDEDPDARLPFLEEARLGFSVTLHDLGDRDGISYYAYIVTPSPCSAMQQGTK